MQEYIVTINKIGTVFYYKPGTAALHRLDGPAVERATGDKIWYIDDNLHREDGPAVELADGSKEWYIKGKLHREDGPAVEWPDGTKKWYLDGNYHRTNGPAVELADGTVEYWIEGKRYSVEEFLAKTAPAKEMTIAQLEKVLGHKVKIIK